MMRGKALFRGIFRCRNCGHVHGAYGVQDTSQPQVVYYGVEENHPKPVRRCADVDADTRDQQIWSKVRLEPDRCPVCPDHPICLFVGGTRIEPYEPRPDVVKPNHKRRGGYVHQQQSHTQKAG